MIERQLDLFLTSNFRNKWIETKMIKIYLRKSHRLYHDREDIPSIRPADDGGLIYFKNPNCLDIATIVVNEKYRGEGHFKNFILYAEKINPFQYIMVESVNNINLRDMLFRNGYLIDGESSGLNYYKKNPSFICS
jgi:hypothetical protein